MAKNAKNNNLENAEAVATDVDVEQNVAPQQEEAEPKKKSEKSQKKGKKVKSAPAPKKGRAKETIAELKKVTWPSFGKTMKQTGMVLSIVVLFGVLVLGIDLLISFIINLLSSF